MVTAAAKYYRGRGHNEDDLIEEGIKGLMKAADGFDVSLGNKFATYATWWIRQGMQRYVEIENRANKDKVSLQETEGQEGKMLDIEDHTVALSDEQEYREQLRSRLDTLMRILTEQERDIVLYYFGLHPKSETSLTLEEIGKIYGVTREYIRQVKARALKKLQIKGQGNTALKALLLAS